MEKKIQRIRELLADAATKGCTCQRHKDADAVGTAEAFPIRRSILLSRIYWLASFYNLTALRDTYVADNGYDAVEAMGIDLLDTLATLMEHSVDTPRSDAPAIRNIVG